MTIEKVVQEGSFDLHLHTTASDGEYSPRELVEKAKTAGLRSIAITDHDTLAGIEEAELAGKVFSIHVIAGVELSTKYNGKSVDILGYGIAEKTELNQILSRMREGREDRAHRIIEKFT